MTAEDDSGLTDEVQVHLNPGTDTTAEPLPARPAAGAPKGQWVDYAVALGADREFLLGQSEHFDASTGDVALPEALGRDALIQLADRLGG